MNMKNVVLMFLSFFSRKLTPFRRFLSGTFAAMTATCITYPLDTARARFAINPDYITLRSVFVKEFKKSGIIGFYHGIWPTFCGMIPYAGTSFFTFSTLKIWYKGMFSELFLTVSI